MAALQVYVARPQGIQVFLAISRFVIVLFAIGMRRSFQQSLNSALDHELLDLSDGLGWVEALRTGRGAIQDRVAAVEAERVLELVEPLTGFLVAAVHYPAVRLQERGGPEKAIAIPPVAGTAGRTAEAEDAVLQALQLGPILPALETFTLRCGRHALEPGLDRRVLGVGLS